MDQNAENVAVPALDGDAPRRPESTVGWRAYHWHTAWRLACGASVQTIASELSRSEGTIRNYQCLPGFGELVEHARGMLATARLQGYLEAEERLTVEATTAALTALVKLMRGQAVAPEGKAPTNDQILRAALAWLDLSGYALVKRGLAVGQLRELLGITGGGGGGSNDAPISLPSDLDLTI